MSLYDFSEDSFGVQELVYHRVCVYINSFTGTRLLYKCPQQSTFH